MHIPKRSILLVLSVDRAITRRVLQGFCEYGRQRPGWRWCLHYPRHAGEPLVPTGMRPDGIIGHFYDVQVVQQIRAVGVPFVNVSNAPAVPEWSVVTNDDEAIGRLAAKYYAERGFKHVGFAYIADPARSFAMRRDAFAAAARDAGMTCHLFPDGSRGSRDLSAWLAAVPKPLGVLLTSDQQAGEFLDACDRATVAVPRDVSVMGVDNDDVFCEVQRVPLSSIITDNRMIGYRAAEMLDGLLHSSEPTRSHGSHHGRRQAASVAWLTVLVPPLGIASRGSTDAIPSDDPAVAQAARFVREHAHRAISVDDVAEASGVSRRNLERRFRAAMGRSVLDAIRQAHVERAKTLLAHTDQGLDAVALASGFGSRERLSVVFQKFTRETPAAYRKKCLRRG